jgi:hypothetical protein
LCGSSLTQQQKYEGGYFGTFLAISKKLKTSI